MNSAAAVAAHTNPTATALATLRRHQSHSTIGAISSTWLGFEYVAMPRRIAAKKSVARPMRNRGGVAPARSLYSHRKYAANTSVKWKISGVRNTTYTGTHVAPTNASVNASAGPGRVRCASSR